jgi:hypothetical protein
MRYTALGFLLLSGCAADQLRLDQAGDVSTQAKATVAAANSYTAQVQRRHREAAIALVASDPTCDWGDYLTIDSQWDGERGLCDVGGVPTSRQVKIDLRPISQQGLTVVTEAVAGLAAYQGALAAVLDNKPDEAKDSLLTAIQTLSTVSSDIDRVVGAKAIDLGPLTGGQAGPITTLIGTLIEMQQTDLKAKKVQAIVAKTSSTALFEALKGGVAKLDTLQDANAATERYFALDKIYSREHAALDFPARVQLVRDLAAASDDMNDGPTAHLKVLADAIDKLAASDAKLRDAFSREGRKKIAQQNRTQLVSILSEVAAIFPAL